MPLIPLLVIMQLLISTISSAADYAVATEATPVLNRPDLNEVLGKGASMDGCGQIRALEFVALPGTVFTITGRQENGDVTVYRVTTEDYPYPSENGLYIDSRSVRTQTARPAGRRASLPLKERIIAAMKNRVGLGYVWGGNISQGIDDRWGSEKGRLLAGVDCSGLLYEATGGYTPRNTSSLVKYGSSVAIAGKGVKEIVAELRPLDLITWPGHVLIVIDNGELIESRLVCGNPREGVRIRPLAAALEEIMKKRRPVDAIGDSGREFVVRRWYPGPR